MKTENSLPTVTLYGYQEQMVRRIKDALSRHAGGISVKPGLVVVDEAHHSLAATYRTLWDKFPEAGKLGMIATPCRMQKKSFLPLYDCLLASWSIKEFIRRGRLSLYDYVASNANSEEQRIIDGLERRGADGDYSVPEMSRKLGTPALTERLYRSMRQYAPGKKGIVYAVDIRHADGIAACYSAKGVNAVAIDCKTPPKVRRQYVEDFKKGNIRVIVNVDIFSEGFDCPDVEFIQIARPTLSLSKYMQMIGRGLRVHAGTCTCRCILEGDRDCVYYLCGAVDNDNIVVMGAGGLYYHVERGKAKRYIASSHPQTENEEFDTAVAGLIQQITGENAPSALRKETAEKLPAPRRQKAPGPLWSRRRAGK